MKLMIARALAKSGMTQSALADAVDVKKGFMSEIMSGKKSPSLETLVKIAEVLGVGVGDLFEPAHQRTAPVATQNPAGFADQVVPFDWGPGMRETADAIGVAMAPLRHAATYRITAPLPWLALLANDVLIVDLARPAADGDIILVGLTDSDGFNAHTVVRRFRNGMALCPDPSETEPVINLASDHRAAWRGTVCACVRLDL